jgi:hypothetical protein
MLTYTMLRSINVQKFQLKIRYNVGYARITKSDIRKLLRPQNLPDSVNFMESRI